MVKKSIFNVNIDRLLCYVTNIHILDLQTRCIMGYVKMAYHTILPGEENAVMTYWMDENHVNDDGQNVFCPYTEIKIAFLKLF